MQKTAYCFGAGVFMPKRSPARYSTIIKILLVMKLALLIVITTLCQAFASVEAQSVTFSGKDVALKQVLTTVEQQTGFAVFYSNKSILNASKPVTVTAHAEPLTDFLEGVLKNQAITYKITGKTIVLSERVATPAHIAPAAADANPPLNGRVVDSMGVPLSGINVRIKGQKKGTVTDAQGAFTIDVLSSEEVLVFSCIGFETVEMTAGKLATGATITLKLVNKGLKEVVVSKGYYNTTQRLNTGNVSKVTSAIIEKQPVSNPLAALTGRVAGLDIVQQSGLPGTGFTIRLRGLNSVRPEANSPLIIVDGSAYPSGSFNTVGNRGPLGYVDISPLNSLNPNDIESIEVLKDADATSIYGSRGANGVLLITTKKGHSGRTMVDINISSGFANMVRKQRVLNRREYLDMRYEAIRNDGQTIATAPASSVYDLTKWDTTRSTDWQDVLLGNTARYDRAQVSLSGGNANTSFGFNGSYSRETTIMPIDLADVKYSGRLSVNHVSNNKKFVVQLGVTYGMDNNRLPGWSIASFTLSLPPIAPPLYDSLGKLNWGPSDASYQNPIARLKEIYNGKLSSLVSNATISYELVKGLRLKTNLGYNVVQNTTSSRRGQDFFNPTEWLARGQYLRQTMDMNLVSTTWNVEPQVEWEHFVGPGKMNVIVGTTFQQTQSNGTFLSVQGYADDGLMGNPAFGTIRDPYAQKTNYLYNAVFGRINYNLNEKYLLNLTARRDGSSRFAPGNRFGNFGAIGAAWIFSDERWIKNFLPALSFGKLRASYGTSGNDVIPEYGYMSLYTASTTNFAGAIGLAPSGLANSKYSWETTKKAEVALELGFLQDRLSFTTSYYHNSSSNQLVNYPLPAFVGFTGVQVNLPAIVRNTGLELELSSTNIQRKNFRWTTSFNISFPRNTLVRYDNLAGSSFANDYIVGKPLNIQKAFDLVRVDPQTGLNVWRTAGGKDTTNATVLSYADLTVPIDLSKNYFGGINNSFSYKGFQLDVFFNFAKQTGPFAYFPANTMRGGIANMPLDLYERRWKQPGDVTDMPKLFNNPSSPIGNTYVGSGYSRNYYTTISFIRLKNISLSYSLPAKLMKRWNVQGIRVYGQAQNLFTITGYKGWDPENVSGNIPLLRVVTGGIQLTL
ncbi:TonB-linked outer membrane protein, SusC/RagA family [Chitinophaga arvensicola]|uniref:TonB-linked outer membrane protein, SusC/RagA family n=2 Tax=Chitinophaga arvensicola TaxID=29529 RepID=A0A1I0PKV5_9BACT|nr:TonB-linked outer membrane protein, SusC/RagA family [Chitinophaga arvensicola]